ncbi:uncharacterized protein LOC122653216 [Telopea speciosissima]|uniref:uncharacterized protein LOC122653216 n=1 Tax=Telopea speciosissima TaxID=54955 RepID=UPI001CC3F6CB|nr:uncharacterized protein LOC122653216 [Telopea speciosissima]
MAANNGEPAEISDINLSSCNFSIGEGSESEIPDSSYSLSFPSEPPDLRNWFSSYVYESPDLDTGEGFSPGDSQSEGFGLENINRIKKEDLGQFNGLVGCQRFSDDDNLENQGLNKVLFLLFLVMFNEFEAYVLARN